MSEENGVRVKMGVAQPSTSIVRQRTLTDRVQAACTRALEARRSTLDASPDGLASVGVLVTLDRRGHVIKVLVRSEACDDLTAASP